MKSTATHSLVRLAATLAPAAALAASCGHFGWSDGTLKQQVETVESPLQRLRSLNVHTPKLAALATAATALAASCGHMTWSDGTLKQQIEPVESSVERLRQL